MHMNEELEALGSAREYMTKLYQGIKDNVALYRVGRETEANAMFIEIVDGFTWVVDVLTLTRKAQGEVISMGETKQICAEMIEALENSDTVLIADMLEYEVLPLLDEWYDAIGDVLKVDA